MSVCLDCYKGVRFPVLFNMGIVENIYDETACIKACLPEQFYAVEARPATESCLSEKKSRTLRPLSFDHNDALSSVRVADVNIF